MIELERRQIQLAATPVNKEEAIRMAGQLLVDSGCIKGGYIKSMMRREAVANTYLGNGIAIPHGLPKDRHLIKQTGISVLQVPGGVSWKDDQIAHLIVGIAAKSDEHIQVLRRLTRVLGNQEQVRHLTQTSDANDIIEALMGERPAEAVAFEASDYDPYFDALIHNKHGLHARPATIFVDIAKQFAADIKVRYAKQVVDGKSMLSLLQLGVSGGSTIRVSAAGDDALVALRALQMAIDEGLEDEEEDVGAATVISGSHDWAPQSVSATITGITAANGLAIGSIRQYTHQEIVVEDKPGDRFSETNNFQNALDAAQRQLDQLHEEVKARLGGAKAAIFRAHAEFLKDTSLIKQTVSRIFQGHSAAWAWQEAINERVGLMQKLDDPLLAARAVDLSDVGQRVLRGLVGIEEEERLTPDNPVILIANDLTPSDTAGLDTETILGFCTASGGPTSHTAIIARSLGIPAVVAAGHVILAIANGKRCILDGYNGKLYLEPSESDILTARYLQEQLQSQKNIANAARFAPAITTDGHQIEVAANINRAADVKAAVEAGAYGVGLMRTEFLFLERKSAPSEQEQFEAYRDMVLALKGRPLIIRTLDIGGDKEVPYLNLPKEDNSFLGMRGIRLCLARPELFIPQLRAIYRAAAYGPLKIMFPMISTLEDLEQARAATEQIRQELNAPAVELGIMIEVPSAVVLADHFAQQVNFFSIGTNDLTQYTLAMDRLHPQLAKQADGLHPAVLRMIDQTVRAADKAGIWVGVCGEIAGDPKGAVILTGLGVSELSVSIPVVSEVKAQLRQQSLSQMQQIAQQALLSRTAAEVRAL